MKKIPEHIKQEIGKLVKELNFHCYRYYVLDSPLISDGEYDNLYRRLKELEEIHNFILPDSPTQRVGAPPLKGFGEVKHVVPMLSLDNATSYEQVREFEQRIRKKLASPDFSMGEFEGQAKDVQRLCQAIKKEGYELGTIEAPKNTVEWLNKILQIDDLYKKIIVKKNDSALSDKIKKLEGEAGKNKNRLSPTLKGDKQKIIKRLNRLTLELAYPQETPKVLKSDEQIAYTVEPKYDGFAIELTYKKGILKKASTRGDGYVGEDVTQNIRTIKAVPLKIEGEDIPGEIDIRGEVYMDIVEFEALNNERAKNGESLFANPRNAAAGSVRQLDSSIMAKRKFCLACYGFGRVKGKSFESQWDFIEWLKKARFPIPKIIRLSSGIKGVIDEIKEIEKERNNFPFEADGAVIKVNKFSLQQTLGTKTREPIWAIAYKFPAPRNITRILSIEPSVGRQGAITPVANFEPVRIGGVTVSRSSLHNWDEIQRKDIRVGDFVEVERAGDVIPHVVAVVTEKRNGKEKPYYFERKCPECDSTVIREEGEVAVKCIGLNCSAQAKEKIRNYASKAAMDIEGLGEKNVELLYSEGLVRHFVDIYKLEKEKLLKLPRFAEKSAQNLINSIEASKNTSLSRFIYSLGINYVGEYSAKLLAERFATIDDLYEVKVNRLKEIKQIGGKVAASVSAFFNDQANIRTLKSIIKLGLELSNPDYRKKLEEEKIKLPLDGLSFVITGTLPKLRAEVEKYIESLGGRNSKSISKNTDYLIVGENPRSKLIKARDLGVKTISYKELMELIKE